MAPDYSAHPYPLRNPRLRLEAEGGEILAIVELSPASVYGGTVLDQTVDTEITRGVHRAFLFWTCSHSPPHVVEQELEGASLHT